MALTPDDAMARAAADGWRRIAQTIHHQDLAEQTPRPPARAPRPTPQPLAQPPAPRPRPPKGR